MKFQRQIASLSLLAALLSGCGKEPDTAATTSAQTPQQPATIVFVNGDIVTVNAAQPTAEAVAIRAGKIFAVGSRDSVLASAGENAELKDLGGNTLLPGLIDTHGHISFTALNQTSVNVSSPPVGPAEDVDDVVALLQAGLAQKPDTDWLTGWGYDDSLLTEKRHPTREDLDQVSSDIPVVIRHVSGHFLACNSKCLQLAGVTADTQNPKGGVIRRRRGTAEPDGVLEETAMLQVFNALPQATVEQRLALLQPAQQYYASYGITTVQDGAASADDINLMRQAADQKKLYLDVIAFAYEQMPGTSMDDFPPARSYHNHFRVGGVKLVLDGSPQGKTAFLTEAYLHPPQGQEPGYRGYPSMDDEEVAAHIAHAFANNIPVQAHANGDAAADQLINAVRAANQEYGTDDRRTVMIHAQTVREDQQDAMQAEGIIPSYFAAHTFYWGDWHRDSVLGVERASRISPLKTTADRGMLYTTHNDTPIVPPDMMRLLWSSVNRVTRSGRVLGEAQRVSALEALKSMTINGAYQYFEENEKGSIEVGKLADLVILDQNPLKVEAMNIVDIKVLETFKEGISVYRKTSL
ncbi:MAG: amidohydrolase [Gammaproteobacteria bacterium]|nr:amidohydrolase [Gammaproteobacteria bacterium]